MSNPDSNETTEEQNMFMSPTAFYEYSQIEQVLEFIVQKDELLKQQLDKNKQQGTNGHQTSENKTCENETNSKNVTKKKKKQSAKQKAASADTGQPKVMIHIPFPRLSWFTKKQHADYLCLSRKFLNNQLPQVTAQDIKEMNMFKELQSKVQQEQKEFMAYLKMVASQSVNDYNYIHPAADKFLADYLKLEHQRVMLYPCFYKLFDDVPLTGQKLTEMVALHHKAILLEMGHVSRIIQPKTGPQNKVSVPLNYKKVNASFPVSDSEVRKLPPCSQDPNCITLAKKYDADIVMCASAMSCLLDNHAPSYNRQWELPFKVLQDNIVPSGSTKHTVFLDKPFVPKILMPRQKTEWYHKFATKALFQHPRHNTSFILESLKNTNVGTEHVDKEDNCSSVTEQITDLEIFEMEESISQTEFKDSQMLQVDKEASSVSDSHINTPQIDRQDSSAAAGNCIKLQQADRQPSSATDDYFKVSQADTQASSSKYCVEVSQAQKQDSSASDNNGTVSSTFRDSLQTNDNSTKMSFFSCDNYSKMPNSNEHDSKKSDMDLCVTSNEPVKCLEAASVKVKPDSCGINQSKDELEQQDTCPAQKMATDVSTGIGGVYVAGQNQNRMAGEVVGVELALTGVDDDGSDDSDTGDEKLVIDAPVIPTECQETNINNNETTVTDQGAITEDDGSTVANDDAKQSPGKQPAHSPITPLSPRMDTPLSPQHMPILSTPSHTPVIPLEKLDVAVHPVSQLTEKPEDTVIHTKSSIPMSPPVAATIKSEVQCSFAFKSSISGNPATDVAQSSSDTENELVIDMGSPSHQSTGTVKMELMEEITSERTPFLTSPKCAIKDSVKTEEGSASKDDDKFLLECKHPVASSSELQDHSEPNLPQNEELPSEHLSNTDRVYNLRKRSIALSPHRSSDVQSEEPKSKRRTRSHTAALPVDRMLRSQTRSMTKRQSCSIPQLDGTDDKQTQDVSNRTQTKVLPKTAKFGVNLLTSPLDNILDAQSKLLDGSFVASLPSQLSHLPPSDTGQVAMVRGQAGVHTEQAGMVPGPGGIVSAQVGFIPGQPNMIPGQAGMIPGQAGMAPRQADVMSRQAGINPGVAGSVSGQAGTNLANVDGTPEHHERLFQGGALEDANDYKRPPTSNVSYSLYTLGDLRIIVRYKYHGVLRCGKKKPPHFAHIQPKLEYQPQYGLEQLTCSEISRAWLALQLRAQTSLIRVRINAFTGEIMDQTTLSINEVLPQRSPFHPGFAMNNLQLMLQKLRKLPAGDYLLSHNPGQLCCHIKTTTQSRIGAYDLHKAYLQQPNTTTSQYNETTVPWIPIDPGLLLPFHVKYQRIPAMFEPKDSEAKHTFKPRPKKKKK